MKTQPLVTARLGEDAAGVPMSLDHGDLYHPRAGAFVQASHVFLNGSGLPGRWQGRQRFVVLETGFGLGNNFLATWAAWRNDPKRCRKLLFMSIERHPLTLDDLRRVHAASPVSDLAAQLCDAWPPLTPNLHRLVFDNGQVELLLALGDVAAWLRELVAGIDAFFLDGFSPARNPEMWQPRLFKGMGRIAARDATVATWTAARAVRAGLASAGFEVREAQGTGGKRDITLARFAPAFEPKRPPVRLALKAAHELPSAASSTPHALVLGAGLAGCATVAALAEYGLRTCLVERHAEPAQEASGNLAGLFHGVVHAQDGHHARFNRACALEATRAVRQLLQQAGPDTDPIGEVGGVLRLESSLPDVAAMRALLQRLGLPPEYVQALGAADASERAGLPLSSAAWCYPGGGWVRPAALARRWLARAAPACKFIGGVSVDRLRHDGGHWQLVSSDGAVVTSAPVLILTNAADAPRLLDGLQAELSRCGTLAAPTRSSWPLARVRGQISLLPDAGERGIPSPRLPIAGAGYLLPEIDDQLMFGATSQPGDGDVQVRLVDHRHNLARLAQLVPALSDAVGALSPADLTGRTAWRSVSVDRLPLIGAVPQAWVGGDDAGWDQPRFVPRQPGLFMFTGLGSRGIGWAPLGAQIVAAAVTGAPVPLEAGLLDAIDPARFLTRAARRQAAMA